MNGMHMIIIGGVVVVLAVVLFVVDMIYTKTTAKRIKDELKREY